MSSEQFYKWTAIFFFIIVPIVGIVAVIWSILFYVLALSLLQATICTAGWLGLTVLIELWAKRK